MPDDRDVSLWDHLRLVVGARRASSVNIEPVFGCNQRCPMCPTGRRGVSSTLRPRLLEPALLERFLDALDEKCLLVNLYMHGEPLLHPQLDEMIKMTRRRGVQVDTSTNGLLLTPDRAVRLAAAGARKLFLSFDGIREESYERLRGSGYRRVLDNLRSLQAEPRREALPILSIRSVKLDESEEEIQAFLDDCLSSGPVREVVFNAYMEWPGEKAPDFVPPRDDVPGTPCPFVFNALHILTDGTITPCGYDVEGRLAIRRIRRGSLGADGLQLSAFRLLHVLGAHRALGLCRSCSAPRRPTRSITVRSVEYAMLGCAERIDLYRALARL